MSVEQRGKLSKFFVGEIEYAAFIDAGNVWKLNKGITGANFEISSFYKEFGVGAGIGLRWNLDYFLFRFDFPFKIFDPAQPEGERFVLDNFKFGPYLKDEFGNKDRSKLNFYRLPLRFGIGYPF